MATSATAELYRWIDPDTGTVKLSNYPPPWYGDSGRAARSPAVEVIRPPAAARSITNAPAKPAPASGTIADLEARFVALLQSIRSLPQGGDLARTGAALRQQAEMFQALSVELDRLDPGGRARRRAQAEESGVLEQLRKGLEAQLDTKK